MCSQDSVKLAKDIFVVFFLKRSFPEIARASGVTRLGPRPGKMQRDGFGGWGPRAGLVPVSEGADLPLRARGRGAALTWAAAASLGVGGGHSLPVFLLFKTPGLVPERGRPAPQTPHIFLFSSHPFPLSFLFFVLPSLTKQSFPRGGRGHGAGGGGAEITETNLFLLFLFLFSVFSSLTPPNSLLHPITMLT